MRILLNGLTQRPGGGMVVLQGLLSGIASVSASTHMVVIVYDETVYATLTSLGFENVQVVKLAKKGNLIDKLSVPFRVRSAAIQYQCDVLLTLNFYVPFLPVPQVVYHVDMERFEHHGLMPLSVGSVLEKARDASAKRALQRAGANVFESNFVRRAAEAHCQVVIRNPSVIYIGIDGDSVTSVDADMDDGLIVVVTSPQAYKHNESLVPILAQLFAKEPETNWRIRVFGGRDISVWAGLIELAEKAKVEVHLEFMGYRSREELNASLDVAVCLLNTSRLESFCMVALESMARGCPVIVSADAAMPESVGDAGVILDPDNASQVVDQIIELKNSASLRQELKAKSLLWASKNTWVKSGEAFQALCRELS